MTYCFEFLFSNKVCKSETCVTLTNEHLGKLMRAALSIINEFVMFQLLQVIMYEICILYRSVIPCQLIQ